MPPVELAAEHSLINAATVIATLFVGLVISVVGFLVVRAANRVEDVVTKLDAKFEAKFDSLAGTDKSQAVDISELRTGQKATDARVTAVEAEMKIQRARTHELADRLDPLVWAHELAKKKAEET